MLLNCCVGKDFWESLGLQGDPTRKDWCWSWNSNTLATWHEEPTHLKRPWCWERLRPGGEGDDGEWDGCMVSLTQWTWVWINSRSCWWTGRPSVLWCMGLQRVGHDWASEMNWTELNSKHACILLFLSWHKSSLFHNFETGSKPQYHKD